MKHAYPKTYTLLVLWMIGLLPFVLLLGLGMEQIGVPEAVFAKLLLWLVIFWVVGLFYTIYQTQNIYWINGISYRQAKEAGEERRRAFALKHLMIFIKVGGAFTVYTPISAAFSLPVWADAGVFVGLMLYAAIKTTAYKL